MSDWAIRVPHRFRDEPIAAVAGNVRQLPAADREVMRELIIGARLGRGVETAGELLDYIEQLEPHERRGLLDRARAECGLASTEEVDAQRRFATLSVRTTAGGGFPTCAAKECDASPVRLGIFYRPDVRRWHCPAHEHLAEPGDLEPRGSGLRLSPAGVPIDDNPVAEGADRAREASHRAQLEAEAEIRAAEAAEAAASKRARDAAANSELPAGLRPVVA